MPLDAEVDLRSIASKCNGYVGADLQALCREAAMSALTKGFKEGVDSQTKLIGLAEWEEALLNVGPSIVRGTAAAEVPKVSWADIGGLFDVKVYLHTLHSTLRPNYFAIVYRTLLTFCKP